MAGRFSGLMRARVTRVDSQGPWVEVPDLGSGQEFGPCEVAVESESEADNWLPVIAPGVRVLVASVGGVQEDIVIIAVLDSPPMRDIAIPAGMVWWYAGVGATPPGWLEADGSSFSAATYPNLAAALGSTTLPDLRGRAVLGSGGGYGEGEDDGLAVGDRKDAWAPDLRAAVTDASPAGGGDGGPVAVQPHQHDVPHPAHPYIALRALIKT